MNKERFEIDSSDGKTTIKGWIWKPEDEVKAIVQIVHGMIEYIERYEAFAMYLASKGIVVIGHDHLGHGDSVRSEEDWGYFAKGNANQILLTDIHSVRTLIQEKYPELPYTIIGHSMGSFLVRQYLCEYGKGIKSAVIIGTGNKPEGLLKFGMGLTKILARKKGWRDRNNLVRMIAFGGYNKKIPHAKTVSDWISRDEKVVEAYVNGKKTTFFFTLNGYYWLFYSMHMLNDVSYLEKMPKDLPILLTAGEEDPVGGYGKEVKQVEQIYKNLGMKDVTCRLYPKDRHEILNELDKDQVYQDIYGWIEEKLQ